MVYSPCWGSRYTTILFKYFSQTVKTLAILFREKPCFVFVMTPPVIACLPVWFYTKLMKASYVIDAHTGAFVDLRWRRLLFLHRFFSYHALTTIVTNRYLQRIVLSWRAKATIVTDVPVNFPPPTIPLVNGKCNMTFVSSFTRDEPLECFLRAAQELPDIHFFVTGDWRDADPRILKRKPQNVELTGFLPDSDYVGLLLASAAVISLTREDHTMQRGAYEAVYLGKPVITSNFGILRETFDQGAVYVQNTVEDIVRGIKEMRDNLEKYQDETRQLRLRRLEQWRTVEGELRDLLYGEGKRL
jgi:glycosyltransferase involved in cell wall biosynthesis